MRTLSYEQVRDIQEMCEREIREIGSRLENEKEVYGRMNQEVKEDEKDQKKMARLLDLLNFIKDELSVVNFSFGFGSAVKDDEKSPGLLYGISASNNDTENN